MFFLQIYEFYAISANEKGEKHQDLMLFALMVVSPVTLLHSDGDGLCDAACRADLHRDGSRLVSAPDGGYEHAVEETHVRLGEPFQ